MLLQRPSLFPGQQTDEKFELKFIIHLQEVQPIINMWNLAFEMTPPSDLDRINESLDKNQYYSWCRKEPKTEGFQIKITPKEEKDLLTKEKVPAKNKFEKDFKNAGSTKGISVFSETITSLDQHKWEEAHLQQQHS